MTLNDDIDSIRNIERYLAESKDDISILINQLTKHVQARIAPYTLEYSLTELTLEHRWTFKHPHSTTNHLTNRIGIQNGKFHLVLTNAYYEFYEVVDTRLRSRQIYDLNNPGFPDNMVEFLKQRLSLLTHGH